jgi:predicted GIY-YIG superfamily endonuclease
MAAWAYMLRCSDGSYYVGCTTNLDQRIGQHQGGDADGYTARRRPVELVWAEEFQSIDQAITIERRLKGWSRLKKEAVIRGDFDSLPRLSKKGFKPLSSS